MNTENYNNYGSLLQHTHTMIIPASSKIFYNIKLLYYIPDNDNVLCFDTVCVIIRAVT